MGKSCLGIDISKLSFCAALKINGKEKVKSFSNDEKGFNKLLEWLQKNSSEHYHCCMKATGKYGEKLAAFLYSNAHVISIVNPAKIKYFMKSQLARNKTDSIDAILILHFCELFNPAPWHPTLIEIHELQELTKRLDVLIQIKSQEQNRLENVSEIVKESIVNNMDFLKKEIKNIKTKIKNHIGKHASLKEQGALLSTISGIGDKTSSKIIAFLGNIEAFSEAKKLAAFVGLNPRRFQSGTSLNHSHLSKTGNADLRKMFYMPTLVAIKHNPVIKSFYEKLLAKGKPKKLAICAAMRKLVHIVYGILKSKTPFKVVLA